MPAPISVVIPTLNAAHVLPATADALLAGATEGLIGELVLSDGGSTDQTEDVARELGAVWVTGPAGRGGQIARGVEASKGDWLLILHADTWLSEGWTEVARRHIALTPDKAGWFQFRFRAKGMAPRLIAGGANLRARYLGLPSGDQGLLISRNLLDAAGGVPDLPLMEDVALARRLKGQLVPLNADALTSAERYIADGWTRRVTRNLTTLTRYLMGADPSALKARHEKR